MHANATNAYRTQQVKGAKPVEQVAMLYERAIAALNEAVAAIEANEIERRWQANKRAQDIIFALYGALDTERGGEIGQNLERLYSFLLRRLPQVDLRNDPQPARDAIQILEPLAQSWRRLASDSVEPGNAEDSQLASATAGPNVQSAGVSFAS